MPPKAARKLLDSSPDIDFDFYLADQLKKTVAEIRQIPNDEYLTWYAWHRRKQQEEELERLKAG